jgi:hypothetical protein
MWYFEGEFVFDRGVANGFKKVVKSEEVVPFDRHITKLIEGGHNNG